MPKPINAACELSKPKTNSQQEKTMKILSREQAAREIAKLAERIQDARAYVQNLESATITSDNMTEQLLLTLAANAGELQNEVFRLRDKVKQDHAERVMKAEQSQRQSQRALLVSEEYAVYDRQTMKLVSSGLTKEEAYAIMDQDHPPLTKYAIARKWKRTGAYHGLSRPEEKIFPNSN